MAAGGSPRFFFRTVVRPVTLSHWSPSALSGCGWYRWGTRGRIFQGLPRPACSTSVRIHRRPDDHQGEESMGFDVRDFHEEVIEASRQVPILVDFWAEWCGPCRILGPILERLAGEADGKWTLAKVDTEAHPDVAAAYGIRSIPDVRLFVDGEVVDGFMGALPEANVRRWLAEALPSAGEREAARELARVDTLIRDGRKQEARDALELLLDREPGDAEARFRLARLLVFSDPERAVKLLERTEPGGVAPEALDAIRTFGRLFLEDSADPPEDPFRWAVRRLQGEDFSGALEALLRILREEGSGTSDRVRKTCVAVFHHLGHDHPLVRRFRGEFSRALHV